MKLKNIIFSWDTGIAIILLIIGIIKIPNTGLKTSFCISIYNVGITVISIVFSLFFASLTMIISISDDDFIEFLEEENDFTALMSSFKITLCSLFISLVISIFLYIVTEYAKSRGIEVMRYSKYYFLLFQTSFSYGLIATILSIKDAIKFSKYRIRFVMQKKGRKK